MRGSSPRSRGRSRRPAATNRRIRGRSLLPTVSDLVRFLGLLGLVVVACERIVPVEPDGTAVAFVGIVVAGADSVFVSLGRARGTGTRLPEPGARLDLTAADATIRLEEGPPGGCGVLSDFTCYRGRLGGSVEPGRTVVLEGSLASGRTILGEAVVPDVPGVALEGAGPGDTVRAGSREEARPVILGLQDEPFLVGGTDTLVTARLWADGETLSCPVALPGSSAFGPFLFSIAVGPPRCPGDVAWDSMAVPVVLFGYDRNFTEWARRDGLGVPVVGAGPFGITGVDGGVFGAATPRRFVVVVTP